MQTDKVAGNSSTYLLGIDGGGTKTDFVLAGEDLKGIKKVRLEGCNPIDIGTDAAKEILVKGIYEVCEGVSLSDVVMYAGLSGGASGGTKLELENVFKEIGFKAFQNGSDTQNIVSAGIGDEDGVILIMGTGSCAIAQHDEVQGRVSGWGYLFDDGGSGYSIARDAMAACFRYIDGSGQYTSFAEIVLKQYSDAQSLLGALYAGGKRFIASFCPDVFECAENGDEICKEIIRKNMAFAAKVIKTAAEKVKTDKVKVVVAGGLSKIPMAIDYLKYALPEKNNYDLSVLNQAPVQGALIYAKKLADNFKEEK